MQFVWVPSTGSGISTDANFPFTSLFGRLLDVVALSGAKMATFLWLYEVGRMRVLVCDDVLLLD